MALLTRGEMLEPECEREWDRTRLRLRRTSWGDTVEGACTCSSSDLVDEVLVTVRSGVILSMADLNIDLARRWGCSPLQSGYNVQTTS